MKRTPSIIRIYLLTGAFLMALPVLGTKFYPFSQEGRFLVVSENYKYAPFRESVVYITHHNLFGAFGLIINKPLDSQALREMRDDIPAELPQAYLGGPVDFPERVFALYADIPNEPMQPDIYNSEITPPELWAGIRSYPYKRVYFGYSGWNVLQLDIELLRGTWNVVEVPKDVIFDERNPIEVWQELKNIRQVSYHEEGAI